MLPCARCLRHVGSQRLSDLRRKKQVALPSAELFLPPMRVRRAGSSRCTRSVGNTTQRICGPGAGTAPDSKALSTLECPRRPPTPASGLSLPGKESRILFSAATPPPDCVGVEGPFLVQHGCERSDCPNKVFMLYDCSEKQLFHFAEQMQLLILSIDRGVFDLR